MKKLSLVLSAGLLAGAAMADEQAEPLIKQLGSRNHQVRASAYNLLKGKTDADTLKKLEAATKSKDVETARRAADLLTPQRDRQTEKAIEEQILKIGRECEWQFPWITCASDQHPEGLRDYYYGKASGTSTRPDWWRHRHATELFLTDLLRVGEDVRPLVEAMKKRELIHRKDLKLPPTWSE